ncbi:helix-hairpin-helix domain-containing protein [Lapidilactobacillus luobeiensis]|uniref:helix-hairpin-helix domain-containing protein n=1 Tax=Lapidilactobacillus luobeiensis TaxID=2950371 RepID=UPI0021C46355|nr:helix-hairpin-helix domain-containing protein [Lapidilactobacillus luobeiensis]
MVKAREFYQNHRWPILIGLALVVVLLISIGLLGHRWSQTQLTAPLLAPNQETSAELPVKTDPDQEKASATVTKDSQSSEVARSSKIYVEIKGAVVRPDVYRLTADQHVIDLVKKAGGLTAAADDRQINLASALTDGLSLYVPTKEETANSGDTDLAVTPPTAPTVGGGPAAQQRLVDLNHADATELQTVSGIGPKKADDIIAYRQQNGGFKSVEDLTQVSGIGEKTLAKIRDQLCVR